VVNRNGALALNATFVEALQGFPEGWTQGTRSQRLKQLGNAVVPQCAEVVGHVLMGLATAA
jgi:site-specific DNA-cytosine methylase